MVRIVAGLYGLVIGFYWIAGAEAAPPNIVIILADDLGFSDVGCYGGEIATPNLDALAANGLRYTQFYNTARCWPTRAALLTGYYPQQVGFDALPSTPRRNQRKRPAWARLLPEYLRPLGYRSYHSGKWHLDGGPVAGGFDRSYWIEDYNRFFSPQDHRLDDRPLAPVKPDSGYYSTRAITDYAIDFLKAHAQEYGHAPFFQYVAYLAPHFPLHALPEDIDSYAGRYDEGWDVIRQRRWQRIEQMLRLPGQLSALEPEVGPPYTFARTGEILGRGEVYRELSWSQLSPAQQAFQSAKMPVHAAMVSRLDHEIGRLIEQLRSINALENTLILFFSDNGASAEIMIRGDGHDASAPPGSAETFLCLGPGWSSAANTPLRRHKTWVHEGGIATPLIVHWPAGIRDRGELRNAVGHVIDFAPTILGLAGGKWPTGAQAAPTPPGRNLAVTFDDDREIDREYLWWLHNGNRALRERDWKLVAERGGAWELYNLAVDRAENHNLAGEQPERVRQMERRWQQVTYEFRQLAEEN